MLFIYINRYVLWDDTYSTTEYRNALTQNKILSSGTRGHRKVKSTKIHPVGAEYSMRTDGRDKCKINRFFRSLFAKSPQNDFHSSLFRFWQACTTYSDRRRCHMDK